jgi:tetratricopeptide (TPR) repeat protein
VIANSLRRLARTMEKHRAEGWGWRYDGLEDWPTEKIIAQLQAIGIDTDAERFLQQATAARGFRALRSDWVAQIPEDKRAPGLFWEDFPLLGVPVLWNRLAPQVICADLIEERLHRVVKAEEEGETLPDVDGMPADLAAAMELVRYLEGVERPHRPARFDGVNEDGYYDYAQWLAELVETRGPAFPDAVTQIADVMSDCCYAEEFQVDLAMALAQAGRREEAIRRALATVERFPDYIWGRISAGDIFERLGDRHQAIRHWVEVLKMAGDDNDWQIAADRLAEALGGTARQEELDELLRANPMPPCNLPSPLSPRQAPGTTAAREPDSDVAPNVSATPRLTRARTIGRNDPCPCGSGKKYKKCCMA